MKNNGQKACRRLIDHLHVGEGVFGEGVFGVASPPIPEGQETPVPAMSWRMLRDVVVDDYRDWEVLLEEQPFPLLDGGKKHLCS